MAAADAAPGSRSPEEATDAMERGADGCPEGSIGSASTGGSDRPPARRSLKRQMSLMDDVRARIGDLVGRAESGGIERKTSPGRKCLATPRAAAAAAAAAGLPGGSGLEDDGYQPRCRFSFRSAVIGAITLAVVMSCYGMFTLLVVLTSRTSTETVQSCRTAVAVQRGLISGLVYNNVTVESYSSLLRTLTTTVIQFVKDPPDQAVDSLWNTLRTWNKFSSPVTGNSTVGQRLQLAYSAWAGLSSQWRMPGQVPDRILRVRSEPHVDSLYVSFLSNQFTGAAFSIGRPRFGPSFLGGPRGPHFPRPDAFSLDAAAGTDTLSIWRLDKAGDRVGEPWTHRPYVATTRPFFRVQEQIRSVASALPGGASSVPAQRAWSEVYRFATGRVGMSWTSPVAYCGNYSCFDGVVSADVTLDHVSADLAVRWLDLKEELSKEFNFKISEHNSSIFIINHVSAVHRWQQGLLIGSSHDALSMPGGNLTWAVESSQEVVRLTARAIVDHFSSWTAKELQRGVRNFTYQPSAMRKAVPEVVSCDPISISDAMQGDCRRVATLPVALDQDMKWLVVVVLPVGAFMDGARAQSREVMRQVAEIEDHSAAYLRAAKLYGVAIFVGMAALSIGFGFGLGYCVSRPLLKLSKLMRRLGELDFAHESQEWAELRHGRRSRIRDVGRLQNTFWKLSRGIETFARFVPETVVRNIVRGDPCSTRLHVTRREVSIMFSDIRDFTIISETLSQRDLLFVLTRYLSVMTHIVEIFDGVVAEVLGDGLLAFWNTPDDVEDHAAKACAAALAMQQAVVLLNAELARLKLSKLAVRIGIHTGQVLSGNIGSESKMKFGCLGDPVNTASRLEGLCKFYGVGVICSSATQGQLPGSAGFFTRRLDLVQVKGKAEPMTIFEVIGRDCECCQVPCTSSLAIGASAAASTAAAVDAPDWEVPGPPPAPSRRGRQDAPEALEAGDAIGPPVRRPSRDTISPEQRAHAELYEVALTAYQQARFAEACELASRLLEQTPDDLAARSLLERAQRHVGPEGATVGLSEEELAAWTGILLMSEK